MKHKNASRLNLQLESNNNILHNNCSSIEFGECSINNTVYDGCREIKFGEYSKNNIVKNDCYNLTIGGKDSEFGFGCNDISLGSNCFGNIFGTGCCKVRIKEYSNYNNFTDDCYSISLFKSSYNSFSKCSYIEGSSVENCNVFNKHNLTLPDYAKNIVTSDTYLKDSDDSTVVPVRHPDLSTQPSVLPYRLMGQPVYEVLVPYKKGFGMGDYTGPDEVGFNISLPPGITNPILLGAEIVGSTYYKCSNISLREDGYVYGSSPFYGYPVGGEKNLFYKLTYSSIPGGNSGSDYGYGYGYDYEYSYGSGYEYGTGTGTGLVFYYTTTDRKPLGLSGWYGGSTYRVIFDVYDVTTGGGSVMFETEYTTLPIGIFTYNKRLEKITIPDDIIEIGYGAFSDCSGLTHVEIPSSITSIECEAFRDCNLYNVVIPDTYNRISIESDAFVRNLNLESIYLGSGVNEIGNHIIGTCSNLGTIIVSECNQVFDSRDNCNAIIETNTNSLIAGCKNTIIPNSVTKISGMSFYDSGLEEIIIPESVTELRGFVYETTTTYGCLKKITSLIPADKLYPTYLGYFDYENCTLYVPKGSKDAYSNTEGWNTIKNIVELGE